MCASLSLRLFPLLLQPVLHVWLNLPAHPLLHLMAAAVTPLAVACLWEPRLCFTAVSLQHQMCREVGLLERETRVLACCTSSFQPAEDKCVATVVWQLLVLQQRKDALLNCEGARRKRCVTGPLPTLLVLDCFEGFAEKCQFSFIFLWTPSLIPKRACRSELQ